jgi:hypothetical protein
MIPDPKNEHTFTTVFAAKSQATNNTRSAGVDLKGYEGAVAVRVNLGVKTAGDNDGAVTVSLLHAANNTASEGTALSVGNVATTNNTAASGTLQVDPRASLRYLFALIVLSGTNSPAYPIAVEAIGTKQTQS